MDTAELAELYDKYKDTVFRTAFAFCRNTADAEDIMQEVFLKRFRTDISFASDNHEKAWLLKVTANQCRDMFRSLRYRHALKSVPLDEAGLIYETPEESEVYRAVMSLSPENRLVIHLYYYEGHSVKEIGSIIGKSETAVQSRLHRARKQLKKILGEELEI